MYYSARGPDPEDSSVDNADILKPNLVAPGNSIWAAWSSRGAESIEFQGRWSQELKRLPYSRIVSRSMGWGGGVGVLIKQYKCH